ncbi:hypothetical protein DNTS_030897 [Danionella cerebrum]|uniref:Receptor ligand binding region domain-containing protein n=1 Tax=Danionella cerebrum TaxID=2873325 RepID=A0A553Q8I5_9TELE|nr:hypothetical protein DNTS_030897 [Danionella translucida]
MLFCLQESGSVYLQFSCSTGLQLEVIFEVLEEFDWTAFSVVTTRHHGYEDFLAMVEGMIDGSFIGWERKSVVMLNLTDDPGGGRTRRLLKENEAQVCVRPDDHVLQLYLRMIKEHLELQWTRDNLSVCTTETLDLCYKQHMLSDDGNVVEVNDVTSQQPSEKLYLRVRSPWLHVDKQDKQPISSSKNNTLLVKVRLLYCAQEEAEHIFKAAWASGQATPSHMWFAVGPGLSGLGLEGLPKALFAVRPQGWRDEPRRRIAKGVSVLTHGAMALRREYGGARGTSFAGNCMMDGNQTQRLPDRIR